MLQGSRLNKELGHVTQRFVCSFYCSNLCRFYSHPHPHHPHPTPGSVVLFFFFFTTPHAKNKSALEFIFGAAIN